MHLVYQGLAWWNKAHSSALLQTHVFLLRHSRREFDENVKIDILGQMAEHFRHFRSLAFSMICSDLHYLRVGSHLAMACWGLCS
jgi:hypothetical protein